MYECFYNSSNNFHVRLQIPVQLEIDSVLPLVSFFPYELQMSISIAIVIRKHSQLCACNCLPRKFLGSCQNAPEMYVYLNRLLGTEEPVNRTAGG